MLDPKARQALADRLRGKVKKASTSVSTQVQAEKGDFKVVLASDGITQYYRGQAIGKIRVAELDDEVLAFINDDPSEAAQEALDQFTASFDAESYEKTAATKTAGHDSQSEETYQKVTQKQLDDQKIKLHPRTDEYYTNITQKQLPEHGQRPGTYEITTEGQFRDERKTFYGADRDSGDWRQEDRNIVTEGQLNNADEHGEFAESDRGEMGAKYDGGPEKQQRQIGEKQLMELLKHHEWTEPLTTTEGRDQLGKQEGELSRVTAEIADKIVKQALAALGNTVLSVGITPARLANVVRRLVSHESKFAALADTIRRYIGTDVTSINNKVAKAQHFGKTANTSADWSDGLAADVLVRQLAQSSYKPAWVVEGLVALAEADDLEKRINDASNHQLNAPAEKKATDSNINTFKAVLSGQHKKDTVQGSAEDDGLYSFTGAITEVKANIKDRDNFVKAAASYAKDKLMAHANKTAELVPQTIDVDEDSGKFEVVFLDTNKKASTLKDRATARREAAKKAVVKTAQMGGAGGMPPAAGPEMGNPAPPAGGADMGMPPAGEALSQEPPLEDPAAGGGEGSGEPKPPGSFCPSCGSNDVDLDNGDWRCNNCGAEGNISVQMTATKWPETIEETETEGEEGFGLGAEEEAAAEPGLEGGPAAPGGPGEGGGATLPNVPVGASVKVRDILTKVASSKSFTMASTYRITPLMLEKLASEKIRPGSVCPKCGGHNTDLIKSAKHRGEDGICWDCGQEYNFRVKTSKSKKNKVFGEYIWTPRSAQKECDGCNRLRTAFVQSLKNYGLTWDKFNNLKSMREQGDLIIKMKQAGSLDLSSALKAALPVSKTASVKDKFPSASCMERLARRFGENATAMSGPCQGKSLAKCVCSQLENLGIYTDGLAAKVASAQASNDPMVHSPMKTCVAMFLKADYDLDSACVACEGLRAAYADIDDLVIESVAQASPMSPKPMKPSPKPMKPMQAPGAPAAAPTDAPAAPAMDSPAGQFMSAPAPKPAPMPGASPMAQPGAKPMPDDISNPMDEVVDDGMGMTDEPGMGDEMGMGDDMDFSVEMQGDFDDGGLSLNDQGINLGEEITIKLPADAMDALKTLMDAIQGQLGDEFIGESPLDVGDVTEDTVDDFGEPGDSGLGEEPGMDEGSPDMPNEELEGEETEDGEGENSIPGLMEEETEDEGGLFKDSEPEGEPEEIPSKPSPKPSAKPAPKPAAENKPEPKEESPKEAQANTLDGLLYTMKTGTLRKSTDALNSIFDGLIRQAELAKQAEEVKKMKYKEGGEGAKVKVQPAQETDGIGKIKDGGKIGHEEAFKADKPDVPRGDATLGDEGPEVKVNESKDLPTVPHGSPTMEGEGNYKPEKGNMIDGNQGGQKAAKSKSTTKTAACKCKCGDPNCTCNCGSKACCKPCSGKGAKSQMDTKTAQVWTVTQGDKHYAALSKRASAGHTTVKLQDGVTYSLTKDQHKNFVLIAQDSSKIKKESQTVTPNKVDSLVDDPDINQGDGAGKGKTHEDKTHSLAIDEKKPSEGMSEPSVPEAPNDGRLSREHTVDKPKDGPQIPAGGGMHSEYDQNEKNTPEKLDQMLGKHNDVAMASHDDAVKIAGQMVKANLISIDELPNQVRILEQATPDVRKNYETMILKANSTKGMTKAASTDSVENVSIVQKTPGNDDSNGNLKDKIQGLFRLERRNQDFQKYAQEQGDARLWH